MKARLDLRPYRTVVRAVASWAASGPGRTSCAFAPLAADPPHLRVEIQTTDGLIHAQFVVTDEIAAGAYCRPEDVSALEGARVRVTRRSEGARAVARMTRRILDEASEAVAIRAAIDRRTRT